MWQWVQQRSEWIKWKTRKWYDTDFEGDKELKELLCYLSIHYKEGNWEKRQYLVIPVNV